MRRTLAVSDIHGCVDEFKQLLDKVNFNAEEDQLVLLGDYVDRGPAKSGNRGIRYAFGARKESDCSQRES